MSFEDELVVLAIIAVAAIVTLSILVSRRRRRVEEEELAKAALARGWKFSTDSEKGYRVHRWSGTTDGISWVAESLRHQSDANSRGVRRYVGRWHGTFSPGINGAIVAIGVPKGKEVPTFEIPQSDNVIAKLAQKAAGFALDKAVDVYFGLAAGKEVDAGVLARVDSHTVPGYMVMAADKAEGARVLSQGLERTLIDAVNDRTSVMSEADHPWVLLRPKAISLARMQRLRNLDDIERLTRAGIALTRAFTFGRRSSF